MNMVGIHVILDRQRRHALLQALKRQAVCGVDAGRAQNDDRDAVSSAPGAHDSLGINPAERSFTFRIEEPGFVDPCSSAIAVNPRRAYVNQASW